MNDTISKVVKELKNGDGGHICYLFNDSEEYIQNVVTFIITGIMSGDHIMLLENDRNILLINSKLQYKLSKEQLAKLHFINNYDFYYSNGNFYPQTILNYFSKNIEPFLENGVSVRTWGFIEWGDDQEIHSNIEEYEKEINSLIRNKAIIISVSAYQNDRTLESLKEMLMNCHRVMITDDEAVYLN